MFATLKEHPYITVGALLGGVALIVIIRSGSGGGVATTGVDASSVAAATALQQTQMQVQGAISSKQLDLQNNQQIIAGQATLADIQGKYSYDIASLASTDTLAKINADQQVISLQSSLSAQTQQKAIDAGVQTTAITTNASVANTKTLADALVSQSTNQMNAVLGVTGINAGIQSQQIQAQRDCSGFIASIFGC